MFHMSARTSLLTHFNQLFCPNDLGHPLWKGDGRSANSFRDAYIASWVMENLQLGQVNQTQNWRWSYGSKPCEVATPGLIDCHPLTHGGSQHEFAKKLAGVFLPYPRLKAVEFLSTVVRDTGSFFDTMTSPNDCWITCCVMGRLLSKPKVVTVWLGNWKRQLDVVAALIRDQTWYQPLWQPMRFPQSTRAVPLKNI